MLAAEVAYSETAFLTGRLGVETIASAYFVPRHEVPFCGQATIATAVALAERGAVDMIVFETIARTVPVQTRSIDGELVGEPTSVPPWTPTPWPPDGDVRPHHPPAGLAGVSRSLPLSKPARGQRRRRGPGHGSRAAALVGHLRQPQKVPEEGVMSISQGVDMGRASEITVRLVAGDLGIRVGRRSPGPLTLRLGTFPGACR